MNPNKQNNPENFSLWDEFRWEQALKEGDEAAAKYFRLLKRFADLPAADELISDRMGQEFEEDMPDCDFDCEDCANRWNCDFAPPLDWETFNDDDDDDDRENDDDRPEMPAEPGDTLFYETQPAFRGLRQVALGWCNVYAVILPPECRGTGLNVLYHLGRSLAHLGCSIGDGLYEQPTRCIAFGKRSLGAINTALGLIDAIVEQNPQLEKLLAAMRKHLLVARQSVVDHLQKCRKRLDKFS